MIIWRTNQPLDEHIITDMIQKLVNDDQYLNEGLYYTTYYQKDLDARPEIILKDIFLELILQGIDSMGLKDRLGFTYDHWTQVYLPGQEGHSAHDHYQPLTMFSWVYFAKPTEKECFAFLDSAWAPHTISGTSEDTRLVFAGNVNMEEFNNACGTVHSKTVHTRNMGKVDLAITETIKDENIPRHSRH